MDIFRWLCVFLALFACFISSEAYDYSQAWAINPAEDYNQWASRHRFLVGDSITFKYAKGSDSVLLVNQDDYNNCKKDKPIKKMDDGSSKFMLDRSGPFYFISGQADHCEKGQKLTIVVISQRSSGGGGGGGGGAMTPGGAPSGHGGGGAMTPAGAPSGHTGTMAPGGAPSGGSTAGAPSPSTGTVSPPAPPMAAPGPSGAGAPGAAGPSQSGAAGAPGVPGGANAPGEGANATAPGADNGGKNSGWNVTPSGVWVLALVSVALSSFIGGI